MKPKQSPNNNQDLWRYAGLATQLLIAISLAVFLGLKIDGWLKISIPVLVWLLPLLTLGVIFYKIYKDTSKRN
jgi:hypothetical protein